jgi:hypothetical protein
VAQAQDRATRERATAAVSSLVDDVLSNDAADDGAETLNGKKKLSTCRNFDLWIMLNFNSSIPQLAYHGQEMIKQYTIMIG